MFYKLHKGSVSLIRTDLAGVEEAEKAGFVMLGSCDEKYNIINPNARPEPAIVAPKELTVPEIKAKLAELKVEIPKETTLKADLLALLAASEKGAAE